METQDWFGELLPGTFDEVFAAPGQPRPHYRSLLSRMTSLSREELRARLGLIDLAFRDQGVTFRLHSEEQSPERPFPLDILPRLIPAREWEEVVSGLVQRVRALNAFLNDIYHDQCALRDQVVPADLVLAHPAFCREVAGIDLPFGVYTHVAGIDLIRDASGTYRVLEDNLRTPSGVSYLLANRRVMTQAVPDLLRGQKVRLVEHYPDLLLETLRSLSPRDVVDPTVVVLTPGPYNSAYFEHMFLAQQMGVELVEGADLYVDGGRVWMRSLSGPAQVDVIYRRIDDAYLDPLCFRPDSMLGVTGLISVFREGRVALANAPGSGVADDKALYAYVPRLIRYYLQEEPILANVETYLGSDPDQLEYLLAHARELVIKRVDQSGGYGMLIGSEAEPDALARYLAEVRRQPSCYVAQPRMELSAHPTYCADTERFEPRRIDLRPFILSGEQIQVLPGGLTRVALKRGSTVVNSSQGGGSKDTWVVG